MAVEEKRTMATTKRKRVSQGGSRDCHEEEHVLQPPEVGWSHHQHQVPLFLLSPLRGSPLSWNPPWRFAIADETFNVVQEEEPLPVDFASPRHSFRHLHPRVEEAEPKLDLRSLS
jgi:hypothetical protein